MQRAKKSKRQGSPEAEDTVRTASEAMLVPQAHLIRIADQEARRRAITVLGRAREPYCGFTDYRLLVTDEHLNALKREAIPFEVVS